MKIESLNQQILDYLKSGKTITSLEALDYFNCMSLAARIHNIRKGYLEQDEEILGDWEYNSITGKKYIRYSYLKSC